MELKLPPPLKSVATKRKWSCDVIDGSIVTWCGVKPRATSAPNVHVLISRKERRRKKNLLTTTMQYALAKENHITVVVGCRKGQRHQCRPPMT